MSNLPTPPSSNPAEPTPAGGSPLKTALIVLAVLAVALVGLVALRKFMVASQTTDLSGGSGGPNANHDGGNSPNSAKPATLAITTTPPGATVILDDTIIGASPIATRPLAAGAHAVRCEMDGFTPMVQTIDSAAGPSTLQFALVPVAYAELAVASTPDGAEVLVDGEFRGRTPATVTKLAPGPHELVIKKDNYSIYQGRQILHAGEKKQLTDVVLKDKLMDMLRELVNTDPRAISDHLDLAHYYYVNNRMTEAAREYVRTNELASLPMEILPADATQAEKEQVQTTYNWDKDRVKHEVDKHVKSYKEYFGNNLDFATFLKAYKDASAVRWDIKNFDWVMSEAEAQIAAGNAGRAVELFADAQVLDPKSLVAAAGLARAQAANDNLREALPLAQKTAVLLSQADAAGTGKSMQVTAWRYLGTVYVLAAAKSPSADVPALVKSAEEALKTADGLNTGDTKSDFERAWVLYERAHLAGVQHDAKLRLESLAAAFSAAKTNRDNEGAKNHAERNQAQMELFEMDLAWAKLQAGLKDEATALWQDLVRIADKDGLVRARSQEILDELAQGKIPMEKSAKTDK